MACLGPVSRNLELNGFYRGLQDLDLPGRQRRASCWRKQRPEMPPHTHRSGAGVGSGWLTSVLKGGCRCGERCALGGGTVLILFYAWARP